MITVRKKKRDEDRTAEISLSFYQGPLEQQGTGLGSKLGPDEVIGQLRPALAST